MSKTTAAARRALPIPISVCGISERVQTIVWLPVFGIFNVRTDAEAGDCTWGAVDTLKESALKVDSEKKSLTALEN